MAEVWGFFANETDAPQLNTEAAVQHLSDILQFPTVERPEDDSDRWAAFEAQRAYIEQAYPHIFEMAQVELIGQSWLITLPGTQQELKPVMLMAHQDVVPVVRGTEDDWTHPAFSGHVDDTYIWGRGAIDMQSQLAGILEAVEYVLAQGEPLQRTLILAFGEDEETYQLGSRALAKTLKERGIELEFVLDEGDYLIDDAALYGAPGTRFMHVCLAEKGYADVRFDVKSTGGHSSNPFGGTSLGTLAEAIARVVQAPYPVEVDDLIMQTLDALHDKITEGPLAPLVAGGAEAIAANAAAIGDVMAQDPELSPLVRTTIAPTMIEGGAGAPNVMPQNMYAIINFRLLPSWSVEQVVERCRELVADLPVEITVLNGTNDPSYTSEASGYGWEKLLAMAGRYFVDPTTGAPLPVVPTLAVGATDARMYEGICKHCFRFSVFTVDAEESHRGVHGTDERITIRSYIQGIRALIYLVTESCVRL